MNWRRVIQLTLVHVAVSMTVVPVTSTLNRIMIADLGMAASLVGLLVALPYGLSPLQVLFGNWMDTHPVGGRYRLPWILIGGLMAAFGSYFTAHAAYLLNDNPTTGLPVAILTFAVWGVGINMASVSYLALLTDLSDERWRSRAVSAMWTVMILSTILTSIVLAILLGEFSVSRLYMAFGIVWLASIILLMVGCIDLEPRAVRPVGKIAPPLPFWRGVRQAIWRPLWLLTVNPTALRFFFYLLLVLISIHAQDVLLEPFGAEALHMSVSETSRLTSIWGIGFLVSMLASLPILRRWGKKRSANVGAVLASVAFMAIAASGYAGQMELFMAAILLLGLGGGLMTLSNLSFMLDMTLPQAAGLYIGAWGVANFFGQFVGNIASGLLRDQLLLWTGDILFGYLAVFGLEAVGLLFAIWLFQSISVEEFRQNAQVRIAEVLALAGG